MKRLAAAAALLVLLLTLSGCGDNTAITITDWTDGGPQDTLRTYTWAATEEIQLMTELVTELLENPVDEPENHEYDYVVELHNKNSKNDAMALRVEGQTIYGVGTVGGGEGVGTPVCGKCSSVTVAKIMAVILGEDYDPAADIATIELIDDVAESGGIKIQLTSAEGDGCFNSFEGKIWVPEDNDIEQSLFIEGARIDYGELSTLFQNQTFGWGTEDRQNEDGSYNISFSTSAVYQGEEGSALAGGAACTLNLNGVSLRDEEGEADNYEAALSFRFKYLRPLRVKELLTSTMETDLKLFYASESEATAVHAVVTSLRLAEYSGALEAIISQVDQQKNYTLGYVELKSGERVKLVTRTATDVGNGIRRETFSLSRYVPLEEMAQVHLGTAVIPVNE